MLNNIDKFKLAFGDLGHEDQVPEELFETIQEFTCRFFCCNTGISKVNTEKGCGFCENALLTAHLSSKLSIAIWRRCIENQPAIPSKTDGNGGNLTDGEISITWYTGATVPNVVLGLLSCTFSYSCDNGCPCIQSGLKCTPACKLQNCSNIQADDSSDEE